MKKQDNMKVSPFTNEPFVNGYTDIEHDNCNWTIGSDQSDEDIFSRDYDDSSKYIKLTCRICPIGISNNDVCISAGYKTNSKGEEKIMHQRVYDGIVFPLDGFVSSIEIESLQEQTESIPNDLREFLSENPLIYRKDFLVQTISKRIPNYLDNSIPQSDIIHTKTRAHPFAGRYYKGIKLSDIGQYMFYMGTGFQAKEYASLISIKNLMQKGDTKLTPEIEIGSLSTLEDDIKEGKIEINLEKEIYKSISAIKETLISDIFQITFIRNKVLNYE